jgi:hypothetical protein
MLFFSIAAFSWSYVICSGFMPLASLFVASVKLSSLQVQFFCLLVAWCGVLRLLCLMVLVGANFHLRIA